MDKGTRLNIWYALAAVFGVLLLHSVITAAVSVTAIPYSEFQQYLREGKVADANVSDRYVEGTLKEKLPNGSAKFSTTRVDPDLANELQQYGVKFNGLWRATCLARCSPGLCRFFCLLACGGSSCAASLPIRDSAAD